MISNNLVGIAGVHYVVSELSRRGMVALPTVKNIAAYDIVALNVEGTRHANIQVKCSLKRVGFFPMPPPDKVRAGPRDYYVLVRWLADDDEAKGRFEGFLMRGRTAREVVSENLALQRRRIAEGRRESLFPCIPINSTNVDRAKIWARAWRSWTL